MRALVIFAGIMGAASLAQFPEFSQQYLQRLAGKVEGLQAVTLRFDATAHASGLTREGALRQLGGTTFLDKEQADMRAAFADEARLSADLAQLREATPLQRLAMPRAFDDQQLFAATYADYRPAVPTTLDGAICAGLGYLLASTILGTLFALLKRILFRRPRRRRGPVPERA